MRLSPNDPYLDAALFSQITLIGGQEIDYGFDLAGGRSHQPHPFRYIRGIYST